MNPASAASIALFASLIAAWSGASQAASSGAIRVYEEPASGRPANRASSFAINAELGRAWIEISFAHPAPEEPHQTLRVRVPGLVFDAAANAILYRGADGVVECAKVTRRDSSWSRANIQPTGRCTVTLKYVREPVDDGFEVAEANRFVVYFAAQN